MYVCAKEDEQVTWSRMKPNSSGRSAPSSGFGLL